MRCSAVDATRPDRACFNVMVLNTARRVTPKIASSRPTFLAADECHRRASVHNAQSLRGSHIATLGLSATPERDFDDLFNEAWSFEFLGPVIYRYTYSEALADPTITPFALTRFASATD